MSRRPVLLGSLRMATVITFLLAPFWAAAWAAPASVQERVSGEVFGLAEIETGLRGYGLSVFSGNRPERFDVEVIGIWRNVRPGMSFILARLSGQDLETSGVIAGMSGSPVYFDERPAGAVAFAWPFAQEAIAGITPIETMRDLLNASSQGPPALPVNAPAGLDEIARGEFSSDLLSNALQRLQPSGLGQATAGMGFVAAGFGERTHRLMTGPLGMVAAAGSGTGSANTSSPLAPGDAVAAVLVDGDLRLAATGTVTDRVGDTLLAFGHPFLGLGALSLPMATAEVVTVLSSRFSSFKITNLGEIAGAFSLDHEAGIRGELGKQAPMIPVTVSINGDGREQIDLRVADVPAVTPVLIAISVLGALDSAVETIGREGVDLIARYDLGGAGRLEFEQSFDGASAETEAAIHLLAVSSYLLQNRLKEVEIASVELDLTRHREPRTSQLVGAHATRKRVAPGEEIVLKVDLEEYRGGKGRRTITLRPPKALPEGRYSLLVGDGVSIDAARLAIEKSVPESFPQALEFLNRLHSRRDLVVIGVVPSKGLSVAGEVMSRLPASVRSLWGGAGSGSAQPLELGVVQEETVRLGVPIEGALRVDIEIDRSAVQIGGQG
ncbi:MAG: hypothetical protein OES47_01965 [Acidobacteriota bacterium]|nr:hypothetical protein [Acidobacteriota bacterium]